MGHGLLKNLKELKNICDDLVTIKKSILDQNKVFQFAHGTKI